MSFEAYVAIGFAAVVIVSIIAFVLWRFPISFKRDKYAVRWRSLQQKLPDRSQWAQAIIEADDILNDALKEKRVKGKNMGERLVEAQKSFTNNDAVWFGHKLRTRIELTPGINLRKNDVKKALFGLRQGLKDIGAL